MCAPGSLLVAINILHIHRRTGDVEQQAFLALLVLRLPHTLTLNLSWRTQYPAARECCHLSRKRLAIEPLALVYRRRRT